MGNPVGPMFGAAEYNHRVVVHALEQFEDQIGLLGIGHRINDMRDRVLWGPARADLDGLRIVHRPLDERLNLGWHRGGEEGSMTGARAPVEGAAWEGTPRSTRHLR